MNDRNSKLGFRSISVEIPPELSFFRETPSESGLYLVTCNYRFKTIAMNGYVRAQAFRARQEGL